MKKKISLNSIKVKSFVTTLNSSESNNVRGGRETDMGCPESGVTGSKVQGCFDSINYCNQETREDACTADSGTFTMQSEHPAACN